MVLLLLLGVPLGGWRVYLAWRINRELAAIRAAGLPTNGEELNRWYAPVPDRENAALVLTQAFALRRAYPDSRSNLVFNFKVPSRAEPLSAAQAELLGGYAELNEAALRKTDEALRRPASRYPIDCRRLMNTPLPHLGELKQIGELEQYEAFVAIAAGRRAAAVSNLLNLLALARTLDSEPSLISQLVRLRLIRMAFVTLERRAGAGGFDAPEAAMLAAAFTGTRTTRTGVRALIGERAMTVPYFRMTKAEAARLRPAPGREDSRPDSPLPCYGPAILRYLGFYDLDYASYLIAMRRAIALLSDPPPENLRAGGYLAQAGEGSARRGRTLSGLSLAAYAGVARRADEGVAFQRLAVAALAIERFAAETGRFPEKLAELIPRFLPEAPEDPFTGWELGYRRTGKGYVVYSVGPDRKDNGGLEAGKASQESYDVTFTVER
jgi:hypothetical protein